MSEPLLAVEDIGRRFGGFVALEGITAAFRAEQGHRDHRPQRRRQEHLLQRAVGRAAALDRRASASRARI